MGLGQVSRRRRFRLALLGVVFLLFVFSVPWYRSDPGELRLILGLPDWVAVAVGCYALAACLNSVAWLWTEIDDEAEVEFVQGSGRSEEREP